VFVGHFAVALTAKRAAPSVSLGTLFLAAQLADLIWPTLVLLGVETVEVRPGITRVTPLDFVHYPYSHSLVALLAWAAAFGVLYKWSTRSAWRVAMILGVVVLSHWLLDVISHRPDMPLTLNGPVRLGLGLWNSLPATLAVELLMLVVGVGLYVGTMRARDRIGSIGFWALIVFVMVIYAAAVFGPPPPSAQAVAWSDQGQWLLVAWAYWVDRHRRLARPEVITRPAQSSP
jgi:hypothetical protein